MPVSLAEIAKEAGVSRMTASRALRGRREVAAETRKAVEAAAKKLGWKANPELGRLMGALRSATVKPATQTLALVWPDATRQLISARMTLRLLREGIRNRAQVLGFGLDEFFLGAEGLTVPRLNRVLGARGIEGLIVAPVSFRAHGHAGIAWERFSSVVIGSGFVGPTLNRVHNSHYQGVREAMRRLRHAGFRRIGLLMDPVTSSRLDRVMESAFLLHHPLGVAEGLPLLYPLDDWKERRFSTWIRKCRPDVVICELPSPEWVRGVKGAEQLPYCTFNWQPEHPDTTGINQRFDALGAAAVDAVAAQFLRGDRGIPAFPKIILTTPEWIPGTTLRNSYGLRNGGQAGRNETGLRPPQGP